MYFFTVPSNFPEIFVRELLDEKNKYRSKCVALGYRIEVAKKQKLYSKLKAKGIEIHA